MQFFHDLEEQINKTLIDVNTKIERLEKIKKRARSSYRKNGSYQGEYSDLDLKRKTSQSDYGENSDQEGEYYLK
jgi:hypothetical protein